MFLLHYILPNYICILQEISKKNYVKINSYVEIVGQPQCLAGFFNAILLSGIVIFNFQINPLALKYLLLFTI